VVFMSSRPSAAFYSTYSKLASKVSKVDVTAGHFLNVPNLKNGSLAEIVMVPYFNHLGPLIATDPRDQIYSRLAFMHESDRANIVVRYDSSWSCTQLYAQVTELILRQFGLSLLQYAGPEANSTGLQLPSWVLNFNRNESLHTLRMQGRNSFYACGSTAIEDFDFHVDANRYVLHLNGLEIDSIASIGQIFSHPYLDINGTHELDGQERAFRHVEELGAWINDLRRMLSVASCFYTILDSDLTDFDLTEDAILRTCVMDCNGKLPSPEVRESYKALMSEIEPPEEFTGELSKWKLEASILFMEQKRIQGRTPIVTSKGYLGLASGPVLVGDHVYIVQGARTPLVFHKKGNGQFELKSDAYVHGIMYGEIFDDEQNSKQWTPMEVC
jgi:hypothetical protein